MCCKKEKNDVNKYVLQGKKGKEGSKKKKLQDAWHIGGA